jgi:hypothetical protein
MAFADFSVNDLYTAIVSKLNTQLTAVGKLFKDQTTGDFTDQVRYNSSTKMLERWIGSVWGALDLSATTIANATAAGTATTATNATTHIADVAGAAHGATAAATANMIARRNGSGQLAGDITGNAATASSAANVTKAVIDALGIAAASASTASACSGNSATVTHNSGRTDTVAYPVVWMSGSGPTYSCAAVTILSSTGQLAATSFNSTSARAAKYDIEQLDQDALAIIDGTEICSFRYHSDESAELRIGFIADDTHELMAGAEHNIFHINNTVGLLLRAVQQLSSRVKELEAHHDGTC